MVVDGDAGTWVGMAEAAELIGCSRQWIHAQLAQLRSILDGVEVRRGRRKVWRFRRDRCVYFGAARERYMVQRRNARADLQCDVTPTTSTSKAGK